MSDINSCEIPSTFPVSPEILDAIEHSLRGYMTIDENGDPVFEGADFSFNDLLEFLSGYDPSKLVQIGENTFEYTGEFVFHPNDVINALIVEVRRLRALLTEENN